MKRLARYLQLEHDCASLRKYIETDQPQNEAEYRTIVSRIPGPPPGESLADLFPQIAEQWDYEANEPLTPELFTPGSNQRAHWVCDEGHKWSAPIAGRQKTGCPICYRKNAGEILRLAKLRPESTLAAKRPDLLPLWDFELNKDDTPDTIASRSSRKVWWKCPNGHPSYQQVVHEKIRGRGCPLCAVSRYAASRRRGTIAKYGSIADGLASTRFSLIEPGATPETVSANSARSFLFRCDNGHEFKAAPKNVIKPTYRCLQCVREH
jgi:hypothetical protein